MAAEAAVPEVAVWAVVEVALDAPPLVAVEGDSQVAHQVDSPGAIVGALLGDLAQEAQGQVGHTPVGMAPDVDLSCMCPIARGAWEDFLLSSWS